MGWKDAPVVETSWKDAPVVEETEDKTLFGLPENVEKTIFPTTSEKRGVGGAFLQALEGLGTPVRMLGKLRTSPETGEKFKASDPESALFRPEMEKLKSKIPGEGIPSKIGRGAIEIGGSMASDPTLPLSFMGKLAGKAGKQIAKKVVEAPNKLAGQIAQELSGVSEEALRMSGKKAGSKVLQKAAGTQKKIGDKILSSLDDYEAFLPDRIQISEALDNMPNISTKKTIKVLSESIDPKAIGKGKSANEKILGMIDDIEKQYGKKLNSKAFFSLRKKIDNEIGDSWGKESSAYIDALKKARHQMKEMMVTAGEKSGNPEYAEAMTSLAHKMDVIDKLKGYIGKSQKVRGKRVESFVSNLFGKNKTEAQELVKDLGDVFGQDFLEQSKLARLAGELGEGGKAAFLPRQTTGRSLLSVGPQIALGSPLLASKYTLPAFSGVEKGTKMLLKGAAGTIDLTKGISGIASGVSPKKEAPRITIDDLKQFNKQTGF